jgi:hypothetical protein
LHQNKAFSSKFGDLYFSFGRSFVSFWYLFLRKIRKRLVNKMLFPSEQVHTGLEAVAVAEEVAQEVVVMVDLLVAI